MRLNKRLIREKPWSGNRIVNCPLGPVGEYYCRVRCPMRSGCHCVYKIIETFVLCEKVKDDEPGEGAYVWSFDCAHCGHDVVFFTPDESLVGSQGFCLACKARYIYHHFVMASDRNLYYLMVSMPKRKVKK